MSAIPLRLDTDPAFRAATWLAKHVYQQLRRRRRIEPAEGMSLAETLVFEVRGLSATPLADLEAALPELERRKLLVPQPDGAMVPKHAPPPPRPRRAEPPAPGHAGGSAPEGVDVHRWAAYRAWFSRLPDAEKALPFDTLWERHCTVYRPRRRATDAALVTEATPSTVTTESLVTVPAVTSAVTSVPVEVGGKREDSLSPASEETAEKTSQQPPARDPTRPALVTALVTAPTVTRPVTSSPANDPGELTEGELLSALRATASRIGTSGKEDLSRVLVILREEAFTRVELRAFVSLAKSRKLYLQDKHDRVSLHFLVRDSASILHRWIDDVRAELSKQPSLAEARPPPPPRVATSVMGPPGEEPPMRAAPVAPTAVRAGLAFGATSAASRAG